MVFFILYKKTSLLLFRDVKSLDVKVDFLFPQ